MSKESNDHPEKTYAIKWLLFAGLLAVSGISFFLLPKSAKFPPDSLPHWLGIGGCIVPILVAMEVFHRLVNRPLLHRPWYQRPEIIVRCLSGLALGGLFLLTNSKAIALTYPIFVAFIMAFLAFSMSMRWMRVR